MGNTDEQVARGRGSRWPAAEGAGGPWPREQVARGRGSRWPAAEDGPDGVRELLRTARVIAVVGLSPNPDRPSNQVAWYLHHQGYKLYGVRPAAAGGDIFGVPVVASLDEVPEPIDIVDVFRRASATPEVARAAVAVGARALWLQLGIANPEARAIAEEAGLQYVEDRCLKVEHAWLLGARSG